LSHILDLVGHRLESVSDILNNYNYNVIIKETFGKKSIKSDEIRIIRQKILEDNTLQLIIAYF